MNSLRKPAGSGAPLFSDPANHIARLGKVILFAAFLLAALAMPSPLRAGILHLDFATNGGVTTEGWTPVYVGSGQVNVPDVGGSGYDFSFSNVSAFQGGNVAQTLTRSGFHTTGAPNSAERVFTLTGLNPNLPVALYACAAWDGNGAGGYIVFGDSGPEGVKAQTIGDPGSTGTLANLTLIGTAIADETGTVSGSFHGRNGVGTDTGEGQIGAFAFVPTQILTSSSEGNGTISPLGAVEATAGEPATYTITPNSGHHVVDVLVDGVSVGGVSNYTFAGVSGNHTIHAVFAANTVQRTINASAGPNGSISPSGAVSVNQGVSFPFTITPDTGYHISDVLVDGVSVGPVAGYMFVNVAANHTISASFAIDTFTITADAGENGTISPDGQSVVNHGGEITYEITPAAGYSIAHLLVDGVPVEPTTSYTFTNVTSNHTISASFDNRTRVYLDFAHAAAGGAGYTIGWTPIYASSNMVNAFDVGGSGYNFFFENVASWDNGDAAQSLTRGGFHNVQRTAVPHPFTLTGLIPGQQVALYASAGWGGNGAGAYVVYGDSGGSGVKAQTIGNPGTSPTLENLTLIGTAAADVNGEVTGHMYGPDGLESTGEGQLGGFVFAISDPSENVITASAGPNGSISPSGGVIVPSGDDQTFYITPNSGYHVVDVVVDGVSIGAVSDYTFFTVVESHTISATFGLNTTLRTISASAGFNGSIDPIGNINVYQGSSRLFTITADPGHHIADVLVNGSSVGPVSSYLFSNVMSNQTIHASFAIDTFVIDASAGPNGSISPSGPTVVEYGGMETFTITPDEGYHIDEVFVDGESIGPVESYTFVGIVEGHTISASFENRVKLRLDFTQNGGAHVTGWTPVYANYLANTPLVTAENINEMGYFFSFQDVGSYDNGNISQPLTRSGFYNYGPSDLVGRVFRLSGLNVGQEVALYACAAWDPGYGGYVVFGDSGSEGVKAETIGNPGTNPTLENMTFIGTAHADGSGTVTGTFHGRNGVGGALEGQLGGFVFAISEGGTAPAPYANWAAGYPGLTNTQPTADPDFDGVPNIVEFALNGSPVSGASSGLVFNRLATIGPDAGVLTYTIAVRNGAGFHVDGNRMRSTMVDGITYVVEASNDLVNWGVPVVREVTGADAEALQQEFPIPDAGWSYKTFRTTGGAPGSAEFIRVGVQ